MSKVKLICGTLISVFIVMFLASTAFALNTGSIVNEETKTIYDLSKSSHIKVFVEDVKSGMNVTKLYKYEGGGKFLNLKEERDAEFNAVVGHLMENNIELVYEPILAEFMKNAAVIQQKINNAIAKILRKEIDTRLFVDADKRDEEFKVIDIY